MYTLGDLHKLPHEIVILILLELPPQYLQQMMRADWFWHNTVDDTFCITYAQRYCQEVFTHLCNQARSLGPWLEARRYIQNLFDEYCFDCMKSTRKPITFARPLISESAQFQNTLCDRCEWSIPGQRRKRNALINLADIKQEYGLERDDLEMLHFDSSISARGELYDLAQVQAVAEAKASSNRSIWAAKDKLKWHEDLTRRFCQGRVFSTSDYQDSSKTTHHTYHYNREQDRLRAEYSLFEFVDISI